MALYAIGDLHLSLGPADKPMDVFGGRWEGYVDKLRENLRVIGPEDTTVLLGDLSWAMSLEDAAEDFAFPQQMTLTGEFLQSPGAEPGRQGLMIHIVKQCGLFHGITSFLYYSGRKGPVQGEAVAFSRGILYT